MQDFRNLVIWQKSHALAIKVYKITAQFPVSNLFGIVIQMQKSALSISSNIAEGSARNSGRQFLYFINIASGSSAELQSQFILARDLGLISDSMYSELEKELVILRKMIHVFSQKISKAQSKQ